jgi:hypothetical protein
MGLSKCELISLVIGTLAHFAQHITTIASYLSLCCLQYTLISNVFPLQTPFSPRNLQIYFSQGIVTTTRLTPTTDHANYRSHQLPITPTTDHANYHSRQIPLTPTTAHANYGSRQLLLTPTTAHANYRSCQIPLMPTIVHANYRSHQLQLAQLLGLSWSASSISRHTGESTKWTHLQHCTTLVQTFPIS